MIAYFFLSSHAIYRYDKWSLLLHLQYFICLKQFANLGWFFIIFDYTETRLGGLVGSRPSTNETPTISKFNQSGKIAVIFKPMMLYQKNWDLECPKPYSQFYDGFLLWEILQGLTRRGRVCTVELFGRYVPNFPSFCNSGVLLGCY